MQIVVDIPDEIAGGRTADDVAAEVTRLAVLDAFRRGAISSGHAAGLCKLDRVAFLRFAAAHGVATMNYDAADFAAELSDIARRH